MLNIKKLYILVFILFSGLALLAIPILAASSTLSGPRALRSQSVNINKTKKANYVEGEVLVKFRENKINLGGLLESKKLDYFTHGRGLTIKKSIKKYNLTLLRSEKRTTRELIDELKNDPAVEYVEPNYIRYIATTPNDTYYSNLWGLHNTGQTVNGTAGTADADIDAPEAWAVETGSTSVTVAVIDTGANLNHPDLAANLVDGWDFVDEDNTPYDLHGHGSHVAGIIGAVGNNNKGVSGVNWNVKIMPLKVSDFGFITTERFISALNYAVDNGVKIANLSAGGVGYTQSEYDAIADAESNGLLLVVAAGNDANDNDGGTHYYPSDYDLDNIISVAASDQDDNLAYFSNYGTTSVDVAAPGVNIYSTIPYQGFLEDFEGATTPGFTGTEFTSGGANSYWVTDGANPYIIVFGDSEYNPYQGSSNGNITSSAINTASQNSVILQYDYSVEAEDSLSCVNDYLSAEVYDGSQWQEVQYYCGEVQSDTENIDITDYKDANMKIRFKWVTNGSDSDYYGAAIDNVAVSFPMANNGSYKFMDGTSMAAPYVAGLAALIKSANINYTYIGLKNNILDNADHKSSLNGKILSGARINANRSLHNNDEEAPTATVEYSTTEPTNENVIATLVPSETVTVTNNNGEDTYTFTENGSFTFEFEDGAGNPGSVEATVENIDKEEPTATFDYSITEFTDRNVIATLVPSETVIVTNNNGEDTYTFRANGSFTFEFADEAGNNGSAIATVGNIDREAPTPPTSYSVYSNDSKTKYLAPDLVHSSRYPYFEWSGATDEISGIKGYYVNLSVYIQADASNGTFQEENFYTASELKTNGPYYLHIKAVDDAGNISTGIYISYIVGNSYIITGTKKGGGPQVRTFTTDGQLFSQFMAYDSSFRGGINVAVGDIDGNGENEIITSTREGGLPTIKVFDLVGNNKGWDFEAYDPNFRGGINIAVGDIEGDGPNEIAVAPMSGGASNVRIFGLRKGVIVPTTENFFAYDPGFRGGIAISIGDIENDGIGDIITTPTSRGGPHIRIFGVRNKRYVPVTLGVMAYAESFRGGINSCVGDVNNDGKDEIMTGIVSAGGPHVKIFGVGRSRAMETMSPGFMAYDPASRGGVSVASIDVNNDGYDEIITGVGGDGSPLVRIFDRNGNQVSPEFMVYTDTYKGGVTLAAGNF